MGGSSCRGPVGSGANTPYLDIGTSALMSHDAPVLMCEEGGSELLESVIQAMEAELANVGVHGVVDGEVRQMYARSIRALADELYDKAAQGRMSWREAAQEASTIRNTVMDSMRGKSTPFGRALAEYLKKEGKTLNTLIGEKAVTLHGPNANFDRLSQAQKNKVYAAVVDSAGKSNPKVNRVMRVASRAGLGLIVLSVAVSVYTVATAEDPVEAGKREAAVTGAGIGGGLVGGAVAGLACGPGAPVCVGIGAFVGGALAAFGVDFFW